MIAAGNTHSLFVDFDGNVWGCGFNSNGQLGNLGKQINTPKIIPELSNIRFVSAGSHSLFIDSQNSLYGCGHIQNKGRGVKKVEELPPITFASASQNFSLIVTQAGEVWGCGMNSDNQLANLGKKVNNYRRFLQLIKFLLGSLIHCFLILKGKCGHAATTRMEGLD